MFSEASTHFLLQKQTLVFQDGTEVTEDFYLVTYAQKENVKYPLRTRASEKLYLLKSW